MPSLCFFFFFCGSISLSSTLLFSLAPSQKLVKHVSKEVIKSDILPIFLHLAEDDQDSVRVFAGRSFRTWLLSISLSTCTWPTTSSDHFCLLTCPICSAGMCGHQRQLQPRGKRQHLPPRRSQ